MRTSSTGGYPSPDMMSPINDMTLVDMAQKQRDYSYAPYSKYRVGCVIYAPRGDQQFFFGSNIENSSFGLTICAERVAVFNWVRHANADPLGHKGSIETLVFATESEGFSSPCGACLQVMLEFMPSESRVIHHNGKSWNQWYLKELLPYANPHILGVDKETK